MKIGYYTWYKPANMKNPEVVSFLMQKRWYSDPAASKFHLIVEHFQEGTEFAIRTTYSKLLLRDVDDSTSFPFRRGKLSLGGKLNDGQDIFALLEINIDTYVGGCIMFSPVPFGDDSKPKLPYKGHELEKFLLATNMILAASEEMPTLWDLENLAHCVRDKNNLREDQFTSQDGEAALQGMQRLGLISLGGGAGTVFFKGAMTAQKFTEIFGVKLTETHFHPTSIIRPRK